MADKDGLQRPGAGPAETAALRQALDHHQAGRLAEAAGLYRRLLDADPDNADALHLLGVAALQQDRAEEARRLIGRAVDIQGDNPQYLNNLGEAHRALGRLADAADCYRRAIALDPGDPAPHNNLGNALAAEGQAAAAAASYRRALALRPDDPEVLINLGAALCEDGRPKEAVAELERALAIDGGFAAAHVNLGRALKDLDRLADAEAACRRAIQLQPDYADAHGNLGNVLTAEGKFEEAIENYRRATALEPGDAIAHTNLGNALQEMGAFADSIACHRRAVAIDPGLAAAHHNLGNVLLLTGRLTEGWLEHEWRWQVEDMEKKRAFPQPAWSGEDVAGRTVLVWAEQGVGDEVLYAGMVPDLVERGARVVLECERRLVPLFRRSFKGVACVAKRAPPAAETQAAAIDYQVAAGSLGRWLRPDLGSFPGRPSYLVADPAARAALGDKYRAGGGNLLVGIAWISKNPRFGRQKSMTLAELAPLAAVPGVTFVDLQYGDTAAERRAFEKETGAAIVHDEAVDQMADLDAFAAQVAAMDLVISVSNTTVHMAGALGVPAWVMLHNVPLCCWLLAREDSLWYPSARLFRQSRVGEWRDVVERIGDALRQFAPRR